MWQMRTAAMPQSHFDALAEDPELMDGFLGVPPELDPPSVALVSFYFDERASTPREMPIDRKAALALYERLHGDIDAAWLLAALRAMESGFFEVEAKRREQEQTKEG